MLLDGFRRRAADVHARLGDLHNDLFAA